MSNSSVTLVDVNPVFAEAWLRWRNQPMAVAFMPLEPSSVPTLESRIRTSSSDLSDKTASRYMWFVQADGELVGMVALSSVNWKMGYAEITYLIDPCVQQRGIGGAAVSLLITKTFVHADLYKIFAIVSSGNIASISLLQKLGFKKEGCLREHYLIQGKRVDQLIFGLLRSEWGTTY